MRRLNPSRPDYYESLSLRRLSKLVRPKACEGEMRAHEVEKLIENLSILVVDQSQFTRRLTRTMLQTIGAKIIYEAGDGVTALDLVRTANPDVLIMEWMLPLLSG